MNCVDLWIHCMLCGSEWRGDTIREPTRRTIVREEEKESVVFKEPGEPNDMKSSIEEKEKLIVSKSVSKSNLNPSMD